MTAVFPSTQGQQAAETDPLAPRGMARYAHVMWSYPPEQVDGVASGLSGHIVRVVASSSGLLTQIAALCGNASDGQMELAVYSVAKPRVRLATTGALTVQWNLATYPLTVPLAVESGDQLFILLLASGTGANSLGKRTPSGYASMLAAPFSLLPDESPSTFDTARMFGRLSSVPAPGASPASIADADIAAGTMIPFVMGAIE